MNISVIIGGALSAAIGGGLTAWAANSIFRRTQAQIEQSELRIQRTRCLISLVALRWVLSGETDFRDVHQQQLVASKAAFTTEVNKIVALWGGDTNVLKMWRDFDAAAGDDKIQRLVDLLKFLGKNSSIDTAALADAELKQVIRVGV